MTRLIERLFCVRQYIGTLEPGVAWDDIWVGHCALRETVADAALRINKPNVISQMMQSLCISISYVSRGGTGFTS